MPAKTPVCLAIVCHICLLAACKNESKEPGSQKTGQSKPKVLEKQDGADFTRLGGEMRAAFTAMNRAVVLKDGKVDCDKTAPGYAKVFVEYAHVMRRMARMGADAEGGRKWLNRWKTKNEQLVQDYQKNSRRIAVDCKDSAVFKKAMNEAVMKMKARGIRLKRKPPR